MFGLAEVREVRAAVGRLAAGFDAALVSPADAGRIVEEAAAAENMLATVKALAARRLAETEEWRRSGDASAAHHLARTSGTSVVRARQALEAAGHLARLAAVEAAARRGELSPAQLAPVADAASRAPAAEERLMELARSSSLGELLEACARTKAAAEPDSEARWRAIHAGRYLRRRRCEDGAGELHYRSTVDEVAEIYAVVRGYADRRFRSARAEGRREPAETYLADGLLEAARAAVATGKAPAGGAAGATTAPPAGGGSSLVAGPDVREGVLEGRPTDPAFDGAPPLAGIDGCPSGVASDESRTSGRSAAAVGPGIGPSDATPTRAAISGGDRAEAVTGNSAPASGSTSPGSAVAHGQLFATSGDASVPAPGPPAGTGPPGQASHPGAGPSSEPTASPVPAKVVVRVDWDALVRGWPIDGEVCEIAGLGPVAVSAVRAMIGSGNALLAAVVTKGVDVVNVAHLGRRATAAQRSALEWRGQSCAVVGCNTTEGLEIDHTEDWATSKLTLLALLERLCNHHHDLKTRQGWALVTGRGRRPMVPPDDPRHPRHARKQSGRPEDSDAA